MKKVIILVEPENPRNIGFVARAMYCNELSDLRIVAPNTREMSRDAYITGVAGSVVLDSARFYPTLAEATADCHETVGFSRRTFDNEPCKLELPNLMNELADNITSAFIFGRESQGLNAQELSFCSMLCVIPIKATTSYNLGQAAAIAIYEIAGKESYLGEAVKDCVADEKPVGKEKELLWDYLRTNSDEKHFKRGEREIQLRGMIEKMQLNQGELHFLLGLLSSLNRQ